MPLEFILLWYGLFSTFILAAGFFEYREKKSRGRGTWYTDRELLMLRGAAYALALVCAGMIIATLCGA